MGKKKTWVELIFGKSLNAPTMTRHLAAMRPGVGGRLEVLLGVVTCSARPPAVKTLMFLIFGFFGVDFLEHNQRKRFDDEKMKKTRKLRKEKLQFLMKTRC